MGEESVEMVGLTEKGGDGAIVRKNGVSDSVGRASG